MSAKTIEKRVLRRLNFYDVKLAAKDDSGGSGFVEGYLAVWNNVDRQEEVMIPGCCLRSIKSQIPARKVKFMTRHFAHGGDVPELIGTIIEAKEDDYGLWINAELSSIARAQDARTLVKEKHVNGLSIGFYPVEWRIEKTDDGHSIVHHTEVHLEEGTLTCRPANVLAEVTGVKSLSDPSSATEGTGTKATGNTAKATAATVVVATVPTMKAAIAAKRARLALLDL